ncbi:MAG: N(2)-acetyl-L-2,4-diaminobutanoate deacetylase DoeB2 [Salinisphaera sp.]|nr:N(2)-acetyl-L-2,4-diaminobutanoate deacetylase DoeB2 [Salinisphaera sp.]
MANNWQSIMSMVEALRHELHAHPELGWQEQRTAESIRGTLTGLDIAWRPCARTGTVATLNASTTAGPHIALRGDMDALPIREDTGKAYASTHPGVMHACGHDGHTATLVAVAHWLKQHEASLPGPVTLLFQPAEEGGHGARYMIEDGALEDVDEIYGWHNWPAMDFGRLACPDGIVMCGNGTFELTVTGRGGHASQPEQCRDPVVAASAIVLALQQVVSRRLAPQQAAVLSVTSIEAPSGPTITPRQARIGGSIRVPDQATREQVNALISEISEHTARAYGVDVSVVHEPRYQPTVNYPQQATRVRALWHEGYGEAALDRAVPLPLMASEDFSYYLEQVPGAFALIGADDGTEGAKSCHSPHYDFNDRLIPLVTGLFSRLAGAPVPEIQP